jgi:crotonobetainyl-CoA:carnitine CoA-transferase CaiB-like acyl-CoA transferase
VPGFDVIAENFKAGTMHRLGLGYDVIAERNPRAIYVSLSGFGNGYADSAESPYRDWPAYASIVEAMSGIYEWKAGPDRPPVANPVGALGDISSALFATIGILAALRHRDQTGVGQYVDIAMLDAVIAMTDVVANFWSLGVRPEPGKGLQVILDGFRTSDGYVVVQIVREHQFEKLADLVGHPEWRDDPRFATRAGWAPNVDAVIRPAFEAWAKGRTKLEATRALTAVGIAAGPSNSAADLIADPHVAIRNMLVEMARTDTAPDGSPLDPVLVPGNPVKLSKVAEGPETRVPWVGEHTDDVLREELDLSEADLAELRDRGVIT